MINFEGTRRLKNSYCGNFYIRTCRKSIWVKHWLIQKACMASRLIASAVVFMDSDFLPDRSKVNWRIYFPIRTLLSPLRCETLRTGPKFAHFLNFANIWFASGTSVSRNTVLLQCAKVRSIIDRGRRENFFWKLLNDASNL